jgi:hypothetical protein
MSFVPMSIFTDLGDDIRKEIWEWWRPKKFDMVFDITDDSRTVITEYCGFNEIYLFDGYMNSGRTKDDIFPLLNETLIRKFIEYKIAGNMDVRVEGKSEEGLWIHEIRLYKYDLDGNGFDLMNTYILKADDLLQVYIDVLYKIYGFEI